MGIVKTFNEFINESVWGDIRKRGLGGEVKAEENIDNLNMQKFEEYLMSHYKLTDEYKDSGRWEIFPRNTIYTSIGARAFNLKDKNGSSAFYLNLNYISEDEYKLTINKTAQKVHIFDLLKKEYVVSDCKTWDYDIKPKIGKVDKQFFITVLDFILANVQYPEVGVLERIK